MKNVKYKFYNYSNNAKKVKIHDKEENQIFDVILISEYIISSCVM